jgi:hypothetical protein
VVVTRRADQPTGDAEQPTAQRLQALDAQPCQPRQPAAEVVGDDVAGQPGGVGGELARGQVVEAETVLEVADDVLDLGVAPVVGLQLQQLDPPGR